MSWHGVRLGFMARNLAATQHGLELPGAAEGKVKNARLTIPQPERDTLVLKFEEDWAGGRALEVLSWIFANRTVPWIHLETEVLASAAGSDNHFELSTRPAVPSWILYRAPSGGGGGPIGTRRLVVGTPLPMVRVIPQGVRTLEAINAGDKIDAKRV